VAGTRVLPGEFLPKGIEPGKTNVATVISLSGAPSKKILKNELKSIESFESIDDRKKNSNDCLVL
jgi:hypothetical protein